MTDSFRENSAVNALDLKQSVRVATTANITLSGTQTIDGVGVVAGNRVLVKNQSTASQNGVYVVAAGSWQRALDANESYEVTPNFIVFVEEGTVNADRGWMLTTNGPITLGSTALTFREFTSPYRTDSGTLSIVGFGASNTATGARSTVGGGQSNTSSGLYATVGGGQSNTSSGYWSIVGGGQGNTSSGLYTTVGGGSYNRITGNFSAIPGGQSNTAAHSNVFLLGSNLVSNAANTTYVENLNVKNAVTLANALTVTNGGTGATNATSALSNLGAASSTHVHGNITNAGAIGSTANLPVITTTSGVLTTGSFGTAANTFCQGNDSRLSDARTPTSHVHGNITNAGAIGSTANLPVITTTSGVLTTGSFGSSANTFCQGNDSRLSDARTPTSHVLATTTGLGGEHTVSGLTSGQVLKAKSATTAQFEAVAFSEVSGTASVSQGGSGATTLTGYLKGNGTSAFTSSATIPGADISGNITGNAANVTGTVAVANGGTGATNATSALANLGAASSTHVHGNITNAGAIGSTANLPVITTTSGVLTTGSFGTSAATFCEGNDARLSDARTPTSHVHGNITNAGAIGSTANLPVITTTSGVLTAGSFGTAANTFCQGNDSRLSDTRTPTDGTVTTAKIVDSNVTYAKIQNVSATDRLLGRSSAGAGVVEEITCTSFGRSLIDDADSTAARSTLGLVIGTNVQAYSATLAAVAGGTYTGSNTITTLGTIATGVWNGTAIAVANGGTGATNTTSALSNLGAASSTHVHGNITNAGAIGSTANLPVITTTSGVLTTGSFGTAANTFCQGNDSRLSDARTPTSHVHGNITNAGAIGSTANLPLITTTSGVITTGSFGTGANTFCQGNDSRLSNSRTPTAHVLATTTGLGGEHTVSGLTSGQVLKAKSATTAQFEAVAFSEVTGTASVSQGGTGTSTGSITGSGALTFTAGGTNTNVTLAPNGTGTVDVSSKRITSLATPTQSTDAATKAYVDSVVKTISFFTASQGQPTASTFATFDTRNSVMVLDFDAATNESTVFVGVIPAGAILSNGLKVRINWTAATATSGDCMWTVQFERMNTDIDADSFAGGGTNAFATNATSGVPNVSEITITTIDSLSAGDFFRLKVVRLASDVLDTMAGDAELISVSVEVP